MSAARTSAWNHGAVQPHASVGQEQPIANSVPPQYRANGSIDRARHTHAADGWFMTSAS
jgi:hypothetical protein